MMSDTIVSIEKMAFGGSGFGRVQGKACFVPFTAPGDTARVKVVREKRSYMDAAVDEILIASPRRVCPPCPVFGICGGCNWQQISYEDQLGEKQAIFTEILGRIGRTERKCILPIVPAPVPYGYRSRLQLKLHKVNDTVQMGFFRAESHVVIDISNECAIADPLINHLICVLRPFLKLAPDVDKIPQIDLSVGVDGNAILIVHYTGSRHDETFDFLVRMGRSLSPSFGIYLKTGRKTALTKVSGLDHLSYRIPGNLLPGLSAMELIFSKGGFSQVNFQQNLQLIKIVWSWLNLDGHERILDLYCGNGNFSLPLAKYVSEVVGIEAFEASIVDAKQNCLANSIDNAQFYCVDAAVELKRLATAGDFFDIVLLDPPRKGAPETVGLIADLKPASIIYVSCDPATLARDIALFSTLGYGLVKSCPVDMFPQTYHIESVSLLQPLQS